jgi:hypothetical protein
MDERVPDRVVRQRWELDGRRDRLIGTTAKRDGAVDAARERGVRIRPWTW